MTWNEWSAEEIRKEPLPLSAILTDSLYYPSSGFDGLPIQTLSKDTQTFVYVDYGHEVRELEAELHDPGFRGYQVVASRKVDKNELAPANYHPPKLLVSDGDPKRTADFIRSPFARWTVLERKSEFGEDHGPLRFSLLYICGDGAATYDAVYTANGFHARYVAIIQPGTGFGGNWTNFEDRNQIFGRLVMDVNPRQPEFLLYGGWGPAGNYANPCWPEFTQFTRDLRPNLTMWRNPNYPL